jgi:hypothetical protein
LPPSVFTHLFDRIPLAPHEHVAVLYRGREAAYRTAGFLAEGLAGLDTCLYLAPEADHGEMLARIKAAGVDPKPYTRSGTLRLRTGAKSLRELEAEARDFFLDAEHLLAPGVRWLEDGAWPGAVRFPPERFFDFHAVLNLQVKHYPSVAVCQYDLEKIPTPELLRAIAVHRHLVIEETLVRDNPFYIPAEKFLPLSVPERDRTLADSFREVGFDRAKLLETLAGYGRVS